ncbi:MAG: sulfatase [Acidobacteria bacterium]|nr:sulfatase [Acidobacteriota bacterium]
MSRLVLTAGLLLVVGVGACRDTSKPASEPRRPNVLLLSVDTLRADHLGCYGYPKDTSPRLDRLAAEGIRYQTVWAPAPWTLPSHATMLTGVHAYDLGMRHKSSAIPEAAPHLAVALHDAGYDTAAWVDSSANGYVGAERGFGEGFDEYHHAPHAKDLTYKYDMAVTADRAIEWLRKRDGSRPFFVFLHTKSVHALPPNQPCIDQRCLPYDKPAPYRFHFFPESIATRVWSDPEMGQGQQYLWALNASFLDGSRDPRGFPENDLAVLRGGYDDGIFYTDEVFGRLLDTLTELGLYDDTMIVVTADHGEGFLEHNLLMHQEVYEQLIHVPLIIKPAGGVPGKTPQETGAELPVVGPAELADVAPTVLSAVGVPVPEGVGGQPLPLERGAVLAPREIFAYYLFPPTFTYRAFTLRGSDHTLVHHNFGAVETLHPELYSNELDPTQHYPLSDQPEILERLQKHLRERLARPPLYPPRLVHEDAEALKELKTLGYVD